MRPFDDVITLFSLCDFFPPSDANTHLSDAEFVRSFVNVLFIELQNVMCFLCKPFLFIQCDVFLCYHHIVYHSYFSTFELYCLLERGVSN